MEESMATIHQLPVKRPNEGIGSGSEEEASKKAKVEELGSGIPDFRTYSEFEEYCGDRIDHLALDRYQEQMTRRCKLQELRYYLTSKGWADRAKIIQSVNDLDEEELKEFEAKKWKLNAEVGPYDDYQRLVVWDDPLDRDRYIDLFFSYDCDIAYPKKLEECKEALQQIPSYSNALRITQAIRRKYFDEKKFDPSALEHAIRESISWWCLGDMKKQMIPVLSKLCHEVLKKKRSIQEVVDETIGQFVGPYTRAEEFILKDTRCRCSFTRDIISELERYISRENIKIVDDEILLKCLVERFMKEDPPSIFRFSRIGPYTDYIDMKLQVAKHLGII